MKFSEAAEVQIFKKEFPGMGFLNFVFKIVAILEFEYFCIKYFVTFCTLFKPFT